MTRLLRYCVINAGVFAVSLVFAITHAMASTPVNFTEVQKFAALSAATYEADDVMSKTCETYQYKLQHDATIVESQVRYITCNHTNGNTQLIAMRGTANLENAYVDIDFKLEADDTLGIKLHKGFAAGARAIYQQIKPQLNKQIRYELTGHSLGGALAVIVAMYLDNDGYSVANVYTYGQPKVTNVFGTRKFAHLPLYRVVMPSDIVPLVPPLDPLDLMKLDIYWHSGREIILFPENVYAELEGLDSVRRALGVVEDSLSAMSDKNIVHHLMTTYIKEIASKVSGAQLLPYESAKQRFKSKPLSGPNAPSSGRVIPL